MKTIKRRIEIQLGEMRQMLVMVGTRKRMMRKTASVWTSHQSHLLLMKMMEQRQRQE